MQLKSIYLTRCGYGSDKGKVTGDVAFDDATKNEIKLALTEEDSLAILKICKNRIIQSTTEAANFMVNDLEEFLQADKVGLIEGEVSE